jgi:hypothetical protein
MDTVQSTLYSIKDTPSIKDRDLGTKVSLFLSVKFPIAMLGKRILIIY